MGGGSYLFTFHVATHDNKKALLSIRLNGEEVASIFDQNHKDNHKNSMAGNTILLNLKQGDEVCVYAYTGPWLADFPMNHYTHWVGLLLKPSQEEEDNFMKSRGRSGFRINDLVNISSKATLFCLLLQPTLYYY